MPPRKLPATPTVPAPSAKRPPARTGALAQRRDGPPPSDAHSDARNARTKDYLAAERRAEAELEKCGYCF